MQIQTILNQRHKYTSFRYGKCRMVHGKDVEAMEVEIVPRKNSRPACSQCGRKGPIYDHQPTARRFDFVPVWGIAVVFVYVMRRVNCPTCGVKVERVPWAQSPVHRPQCTVPSAPPVHLKSNTDYFHARFWMASIVQVMPAFTSAVGLSPAGWRLKSPSEIELLGDACDLIQTGDHRLRADFPCEAIITID